MEQLNNTIYHNEIIEIKELPDERARKLMIKKAIPRSFAIFQIRNFQTSEELLECTITSKLHMVI